MSAEGRFTRTGVFSYLLGDGSTRRELRLPDEVFSTDSMETFKSMPVTNEHPRDANGEGINLTSDNAKEFSVGSIANVNRQDQWMVGEVMITDSDTIRSAENGRSNLSLGYYSRLEFTKGVTKGVPGVQDGQHYDAIQREIKGNHIAIVDSPRAGPGAELRLDASEGIMVDSTSNDAKPHRSRLMEMIEIKIDGVTYEVPKQTAEAFRKAIDRRDSTITDLTTKADSHTTDISKETARADKAEEDLTTLKTTHDEATSPEAIKEVVAARVSLVQTAGKILGEIKNDGGDPRYKVDSMSDVEIKKAVILETSKADRTELSAKMDGEGKEGYIQARFDQVVESIDESADGSEGTNPPAIRADSIVTGAGNGGQSSGDKGSGVKTAAQARQDMIDRRANAWKDAAAKA